MFGLTATASHRIVDLLRLSV